MQLVQFVANTLHVAHGPVQFKQLEAEAYVPEGQGVIQLVPYK